MADNTRKLAFGGPLVQTDVDAANPLPVIATSTPAAPLNVTVPTTTAALTSVASAITTSVLLAASTTRRGFIVFNESTAILHVALAATASLTAYTVQVPAGGSFTMPTWPSRYVGDVSGIWVAANGFARVTSVS